MKIKPFGHTGLQVSELILGGGFVGGILLNENSKIRHEVVHLALESGVNWIDTAASYGNGKSEEAVGLLLRDLPPNRFPNISSKFRVTKNNKKDIAEEIRSSLFGSLSRLQTEKINLFILHNPIGDEDLAKGVKIGDGSVPLDIIMGAGGVCETLEELKKSGLIDCIGFTALGSFEDCIKVVRSERMDAAQVYYNLLNPTAGITVGPKWSTNRFDGLISTCENHGVAVMNIRAFAAGILASTKRHGREIPITRNATYEMEFMRAKKVFNVLGEIHGSRAQTALRFCLGHPGIAGVVIGLAKRRHLEEALDGARMGSLPRSVYSELERLWETDFE